MEKITGKWVVGVSGGVDSMALLSKCYESCIDVIVAHVNYNKRDSASRDEQGVRVFCEKRNIPFYKLNVSEYTKENFQAQARNIRYAFFNDLVIKYNCEGVLVAHHLDDVIETYFLQEQRGNIPSYYGLKHTIQMGDLKVVRLLLNETKEALIQYCEKTHVLYFEDESNGEDDYERNKIRHQKVEQMTLQQKKTIIDEISIKNTILSETKKQVEQLYSEIEKPLRLSEVSSIEKNSILYFLRYWIKQETSIVDVSMKHLKKLRDHLNNNKPWLFHLPNNYMIEHEYGVLSIYKEENNTYAYTMNKLDFIETPYVSIKSEGKVIQGIHVEESDFPLVIRNYQKGDKIKLRFGTKRVSRVLIDKKIPRRERQVWPVVVNNMGEIIFVCGIGCDIAHYSNNLNMFVVK